MQIQLTPADLKRITGLTNKEIAAAIGKGERTVEQYLAAPESSSFRKMPEADKMLLILRHKIKQYGYDPNKLILEFLDGHH